MRSTGRVESRVTLGNLSTLGQAIILALTGNDGPRARAVVEVMIGDRSLREVSRRYRVPKTTLAREVAHHRVKVRGIMRRLEIPAGDLMER